MTTIAYKDGVLAFDSRVTSGSCMLGTCIKGEQLPSGELIACCGELSQCQLFIKWARSGFIMNDFRKALEAYKLLEFTVVLIKTNGKILEFNDSLNPVQYTSKMYAWGSGSTYALGCMHFGGTAVQAVQVAKKLDTCTGGKVRTLTLQGKLCKPKRNKS